MKLSKILIAMGLAGASVGMAHAAPISKTINLTAQIHDAIFVSKPDGSTWYGTEELTAKDYKQEEFTKTLPIRVWTTGPGFNVSLSKPLQLSNGPLQMDDSKVFITHSAGDTEVKFGKMEKIVQVAQKSHGYDEQHDLKISVKAPSKPANSTLSTNGSYSGELVLLFEPAP
ncbi:fimbrial assembly protein [Achromobacter sp.]|uniref:fimbrial assembly protein n=1 Tax=Achromobacter sp. TaxID=134375 RepID=UPI003C789D13